MEVTDTHINLTFRGNTQEAWCGRVALSLVLGYCNFTDEERNRINALLTNAEDEADGILAVPLDDIPPF